ncbi:uncharacterized protein TNCV_3882821 [Trichonephila clavipes]|nr:uncharacterized protein TNCV_3882821 [Trichonephila clavipes]
MEVLLNLFLQLCCPRCFEEGILLSEDSTYGLCSNFVIRCKHCDFYSGFSSSKKTLNCPNVNARFVYGMRQIGEGFSAGFKLCGTLNLPRLSKKLRTLIMRILTSVISEVSELSMQKAASELLVLHPTKNKIVECGISVDGTWQRRGYSSMNGCVAALSVDTGKLTDSFIDRLKIYYGIAVRSNVGNLSGLQKNVIAALFHCSSSVEKPMHGQCPIGKDSWCYYQRALSCDKKPNENIKAYQIKY